MLSGTQGGRLDVYETGARKLRAASSSEITNPAQLELFMEFVDMIQVGTETCRNLSC
jgi:3-deoxy-D-arabino-heptulosonate 7-phosphate (DAHP) synthase